MKGIFLAVALLLVGAWAPWQGVIDIPCCQAIPYSAFDTARNAATSTFTNGNRTWTCSSCTGIEATALGTFSHTQGKWHFEMTADTTDATCCYQIGIAGTTLGLHNPLGDNPNVGVGYEDDGKVYINNAVVTTLAAYAPGDIICFDVDMDNKRLYIWPSTGTRPGSGINFATLNNLIMAPAISTGFSNSGQVTLNVGQTAGACTSSYAWWH